MDTLLTSKEMAQAQIDVDRREVCVEVVEGFGSCEGCSAGCRDIALAQERKTKRQIAKRMLKLRIWDSEFDKLYKELRQEAR